MKTRGLVILSEPDLADAPTKDLVSYLRQRHSVVTSVKRVNRLLGRG